AGRDVLAPQVERQRFLLHPAWPQPVDEDARAVAAGGWFIGALGADIHASNPSGHAGTERLHTVIPAQSLPSNAAVGDGGVLQQPHAGQPSAFAAIRTKAAGSPPSRG